MTTRKSRTALLAILLDIAVELEREDRIDAPAKEPAPTRKPTDEVIYMPGRAFIRPIRLH